MSRIRKHLIFFLKLCVSGVLALVILSLFSLVYYNQPIAVPQAQKYTNSAYVANTWWSDWSEGWGFGMTNTLGYIDTDTQVPENPDVIFMGSSHTEALQVKADKNFTYLTEQLLAQDANAQNDYSCLNLGISAHTFGTYISNFPHLVESFDGMKYVVIETSSFDFTAEQFDKMLNGGYHEDFPEKGVLYKAAQQVPYFRLLAHQLTALQSNSGTGAQVPEFNADAYRSGFAAVADFLAETAREEGFTLVILYHTRPTIGQETADPSGRTAQQLDIVKEVCTQKGLTFVDTYPVLAEHFAQTHEHSYGFSNTKPGFGHLNETGHRLIAQTLYSAIVEMEEVN